MGVSDPISAGRLRRLTRRQRKKLHAGEFQQLLFEAKVRFQQPLDDAAYDPFMEAFTDFVESRQLIIAGFGGQLPLVETDGVVASMGRGSPTEEDRQAVLAWLRARPEVAHAEVEDFVDAWHGW